MPAAIAARLGELGVEPETYRRYLASEGRDAYTGCEREAEDDHIFGVMIFLFGGQPFWGHDDLPQLAERLVAAGLAC
jgi:2-hydroxychromene-2-carboxylate isomerase